MNGRIACKVGADPPRSLCHSVSEREALSWPRQFPATVRFHVGNYCAIHSPPPLALPARRVRHSQFQPDFIRLAPHAVPHVRKSPEQLAHFRACIDTRTRQRTRRRPPTAIRPAPRPRRGAARRARDTTPAAPRAAATQPTDRGTPETGCLPRAGCRRTAGRRMPGAVANDSTATRYADPEEQRARDPEDGTMTPGDHARRVAGRRHEGRCRFPAPAPHRPIDWRRHWRSCRRQCARQFRRQSPKRPCRP